MIEPVTSWTSGAVEACSPAMRAVVSVLATVAGHDVPVLLHGESGSGKSNLGRALHAASSRRARRLVAVDCQGLQGRADASRELGAMIETAAGGTILLEEVGALPERCQGTVAYLLEQHRLCDADADIRVIATAHGDLEAAVRAGRFREDLLTRLDVVEIRVPPLRERHEDILPLARSFLLAFKRPGGEPCPALTARAEEALVEYRWPGNVRELRNAVQRALIVSPGPLLDVDAFAPRLGAAGGHA